MEIPCSFTKQEIIACICRAKDNTLANVWCQYDEKDGSIEVSKGGENETVWVITDCDPEEGYTREKVLQDLQEELENAIENVGFMGGSDYDF